MNIYFILSLTLYWVIVVVLIIYSIILTLLNLFIIFPIINNSIIYQFIRDFLPLSDFMPHNENSDISNYIFSYLRKTKPGYSIFIDGNWGIGKTYFIKHIKIPFLSKLPCYVSLHGVTDKKDFEFRLWQSILFDKKLLFIFLLLFIPTVFLIYIVVVINLPQYLGLSIDEITKNWPALIPIFGSILLLVWQFIKFNLREILLQFRFLILDDFERTEISTEVVFSWISELVENKTCPIIIIGNETEIENKLNNNDEHKDNKDNNQGTNNQGKNLDSEKLTQYKCIKEKIIGKTLHLKSNDKIICLALISELHKKSQLREIISEHLDWFIDIILKPLHDHLKLETNYRALRYCLDEFEYYFNDYNEYISNKLIWQELLPRFFSIIYIKQVHSLNKEIIYNEKLSNNILYFLPLDQYDDNLKKFKTLYPIWNKTSKFFTSNIWEAIFASEPILKDQLTSFFEDYLHPEKSILWCWNNFINLKDSQLKDLKIQTYKIIKEQLLRTPSEIINLAQSISSNINLLNLNVNFIRALFIKYINNVSNTQEFKNCIENFKLYELQMNEVKRWNTSAIPFADIKKHLFDVMDKIYYDLFDKLIEQIRTKPSSFSSWYYVESRNDRDLFSGKNPKDLWLCMINLIPKDFNEIMNDFRAHVIYFPRNMKNEEIIFWEDFCNLAQNQLEEWKQNNKEFNKCQIIKECTKAIEAKLDEYRRQE